MLQAAINGTRTKAEHPSVPVSIQEIVGDAIAVVQAGAESIHFHVRNYKGEETLEPHYVHEALFSLRQSGISVPVGISTGAWIVPDLTKRLDLIKQWEVLPDFVSLNIHEEGFEQLANLLLTKGIGIEAGIYGVSAAKSFVASHFSSECLRVMLEPQEQSLAEAQATVEAMISLLNTCGLETPRLLHGFDATTWYMLKLAKRYGYATRIGLEDGLLLPDGEPAKDNASLVHSAQNILKQAY